MAPNPNKLSQFWQELKRRKVTRIITVYAAAAFVILELTDIVAPSLGLPDWTLNFIIILLCVGFIIAVIVSWIYDIHPEGGIVKTEPVREVKNADVPPTTNSWKIATYVSVVVIIGLLAFNIFGNRETIEIDESLAKSIAVLPFHNYSGDSSQDPICLGLTDEIISNLYKVSSFDEVRSLTSILIYQDPVRNIQLIANELKVNYILEGSFKRIGNEMRVTAQLIEPKSDKHIWLKNYDLQYKEVIGIPAEVALQIADHLKTFIADSEHRRIERIPTDNLEAYETLKQAQYLISSRDNYNVPQAVEVALEAISIDPEYADAYAFAGVFTLWQGVYSGSIEIQYAALNAIPYIDKALELDQNNASAHICKAMISEWARWDYIEAEKEYLEAIELEPNNLFLYLIADEFFIKMHQLDAFWMIMDKSPEKNASPGENIMSHILSGNIREAYNAIIKRSAEEQEYRWIGEHYLWLGEYDSAKFYLEYAMNNKHPDMSTPRFQASMALAYEQTNNHQQAQRIINQLMTNNDTSSAGSPAYFLGWYYSGIQDLDSAFYWLEKAYQNHSPEFSWYKVDPIFNNLTDDPRYWDLYERTGHKPYDEYMESKQQ